MIYGFINEHREYPVAKWARFFMVSNSGYYDYKKRRKRSESNESAYKERIKRIFDESGGTYGPDRVCGVLRRSGQKASYRKVSGYMAGMGLRSIHNRHRTRSMTDSRKARGEGYANLINGLVLDKPGQAVCSDITYLKSGEGWLYLCMVKDIVSGEILGESTSTALKTELVMKAFFNAHARHGFGRGTIYHSDRGSQYTSNEFMKTLAMYGIRQSFSRVGMPGDNAWAESFFATLKKECIHFRSFATRDELRQTVFEWIECFYNTRRVQERLGYLSPRAYAKMMAKGCELEAA
jgi:putative transposase